MTEELAPVAPTAADDNDEQAERQVDGGHLADAVEAGAGARPVLDIDGAFERQPLASGGSVKIPRGDADVAVARVSARVSSRQVALSTGYTPSPGFVPTHIPNF